MALDLFGSVNYSDGEGIVYEDSNAAQLRMRAFLSDAVLQSLIGALDDENLTTTPAYDPEYGGQNGVNVSTRRAYALSPGAAFLRRGSANHKLVITPGTLFQKVDTTTGDNPTLLAFTFDGTTEFTLTNGDATNPRVDLLQIKLEVITDTAEGRDFEDVVTRVVTSTTVLKRHRVQCTLSVKAGTPAVSPTIPTPDTGYVPVGAAVVGNGWTTAGNAPIFGEDTAAANNVVIHDHRMPLRVKAYRVDPTAFKLVTAWALSNNNSTVTSSNATNDLYVPYLGPFGRLVGIGIEHSTAFANTHANRLGCSTGPIITSTFATRNQPGFVQTSSADGALPHDERGVALIDALLTPSAGPTLVPIGAPWNLGMPLWTNGRRSPQERVRLAASNANVAPSDSLVLRIQSGNTALVLGAVTFFVAEGV